MNPSDLELKLLVVFEAICSTGRISHTAEKLAVNKAVADQFARLHIPA